MDDRLHDADLRVAEEGAQSRTNHRLAGDIAILFGNIAAGAFAASGCDDDSSHHARHEVSLLPAWRPGSKVPRVRAGSRLHPENFKSIASPMALTHVRSICE